MPASVFKLMTSYSPKSGDFVCLPYLDGKKPAYSAAAGPKTKMKIEVPKDAGASKVIWAGKAGDSATGHVTKVYRLDKKYSTPVQEAKNMVVDALRAAKVHEAKRVIVMLDAKKCELLAAVQEGALLGGYAFDKYLEKKEKPLAVFVVTGGAVAAGGRKVLKEEATVAECVNFARDILNEPPNVCKPPVLAKWLSTMGRKSGLKITVWNEKRLEKERCGGIIGVGQGAKAKPRLVVGEYSPRGAKAHIALVGKGVTFDSGGYCLKPSASQIGMKYDMGGAAMMFASACAIAKLKLPVKVTVFTPLVENDISGEAYHTTSILKTRSGKTVEVHNTDAEGRLILADALTLAAEKKPDCIVDAATLTGACVVALGEDFTGVYGTDAKMTQSLVKSGSETGELFWEMPLHMPYAEQLKCTIADCKNIGSKWGGSITAALFLKQWVPDGMKWIHCDIAGPGCKEEPLGHLGKGAKGFGVKSIAKFAKTFC